MRWPNPYPDVSQPGCQEDPAAEGANVPIGADLSSLPGNGTLNRSKERVVIEQKSLAELAAKASNEDTKSFLR